MYAKALLVDTFVTGQIGFAVGDPKPLMNKINLAPKENLPVVASTSFPCVQNKFGYGFEKGLVSYRSSVIFGLPES